MLVALLVFPTLLISNPYLCISRIIFGDEKGGWVTITNTNCAVSLSLNMSISVLYLSCEYLGHNSFNPILTSIHLDVVNIYMSAFSLAKIYIDHII